MVTCKLLRQQIVRPATSRVVCGVQSQVRRLLHRCLILY
jgi:hypothetical protein